MVAYNARILETSASPQRRHQAERMMANLRPVLERLERDEAARLRRIEACSGPPASSFEGQLQRRVREKEPEPEYETVWSGGEGLSGYRQRSVE